MTQDEIMVKLGVDTSSIATGLRSAGEHINQWATSQVNSIKGVFGGIMAAFSVQGGLEFVKGLPQFAKQIRETAAMAGVTTDFIQGLTGAANKLGVSAESAGTAINFLSRKLGEARTGNEEAINAFSKWGINWEGKSTDQLFYEIADSISSIIDPSIRAAEAQDLLGRSSKEMIEMLSQGGGAIKGLAAGVDKLDEATLQRMTEAQGRIDEFIRKFKILATLAVGQLLEDYAPDIGKPKEDTGGFSEEEITRRRDKIYFSRQERGMPEHSSADLRAVAIGQLKREELERQKEKDDQTEFDAYEARRDKRMDAEQKKADADDKEADDYIKRREKRHQKEADEQAAYDKDHDAIMRNLAMRQFQESQEGALYPTIEALAKHRGPFQRISREIELAQQDQVNARGYGNTRRAEYDREYGNYLKGILEDMGIISPEMRFERMDNSLQSANEALTELNRKAGAEGVKIIPITGP